MAIVVKIRNQRIRTHLKEHIRYLNIVETPGGLSGLCWISAERVGSTELIAMNRGEGHIGGNWINLIGFSRIDGYPMLSIPDGAEWLSNYGDEKYIYSLSNGRSMETRIGRDEIEFVPQLDHWERDGWITPSLKKEEEKTISIRWYNKGKLVKDEV